MISHAVVEEVRRLLAEGRLSQRAIAGVTHVSRNTVGAIATGKRPDYPSPRRRPPGHPSPQPTGPPRRCAGCGGMVYMPCRTCRTRRTTDRRFGLPVLRLLVSLEEPLGVDLRGEHRMRYEEVRAQRIAAEQSNHNTADVPEVPEPDAFDPDDDAQLELDPADFWDAFDLQGGEPADEGLDALCFDEMLLPESTGEPIA